MKKYNKVKMRHGNVNHSFGVPKESQERNQKRYGNLYNSLDFRIHEQFSFSEHPHSATKVGYIQIGGKEFEVTMAELNKLGMTCFEAVDLAKKKYRLGLQT
tara:strand:- start:21 stop:323 length:303 start_codon:yes stop_codon:yes gene_type:complete